MSIDIKTIRLITAIEHGMIKYDKCYICGWQGLAQDVMDNKCPQCDSEDMDDIDGNQYDE